MSLSVAYLYIYLLLGKFRVEAANASYLIRGLMHIYLPAHSSLVPLCIFSSDYRFWSNPFRFCHVLITNHWKPSKW
ncbi:hypothetical protein O6H91_Y178300 [Diphasiastrum complanatum]|nr:hypothetical protein O6H91_Y178300 [Diphasiastrum complanatum]